MPPPIPSHAKRFKANPIRPARYRPGKGVQEEDSSEEDEEEEVEVQKKPASKSQSRAPPQKPKAPVHEEEEDDDEEGFVTEEEDESASVAAAVPPPRKPATIKKPSLRDRISPPPSKAVSDEESEEEESEEESVEGSAEEESSSEDEPQRKFQRPTFIRKVDRQKSPSHTNTQTTTPSIAVTSSAPEVDEQARRLEQAELFIKDKLERDAVARSQGKKAWDDDEEVSPEAQVDDTDGLDPAAEHAAWKLRELKRLKRDREAIEAREKEIEELERRRNLTQEERDAEDREYIDKQKAERDEGRSKANYLAKYHHKGAFFQDDEMAEVLKKRDIMGAKFQDEVTDKSVLPEYMRIRDMTKLGKKGRTRYTDLKGEDTGRFGDAVKRWKGSGYTNAGPGGQDGPDLRGVDERFLPDKDRDRVNGPTGANASAVGQRRERRYSRSRSRSRSPRGKGRQDSRDRGDSYRPRRRSYSYSRSRSSSRTPPRRKRSPSPYADRDKRRRIDVD